MQFKIMTSENKFYFQFWDKAVAGSDASAMLTNVRRDCVKDLVLQMICKRMWLD